MLSQRGGCERPAPGRVVAVAVARYGTVGAAPRAGARRGRSTAMESMQDPLWLAGLALAMAATGTISGTLAGLLGVGGGIVIVPVLFNVFPLFGIPEAVQMKLAVGTSLATILPTSVVSARKHRAKGAMDMDLLRSI